MNSITPIMFNMNHNLGIKKSNNNSEVNFKASGSNLGREAVEKLPLVIPAAGLLFLRNARQVNKTSEVEDLEKRKQAAEEKVNAITFDKGSGQPYLKTNSLQLQVIRPVFTQERFKGERYGRFAEYSKLCSQSMDILEKFLDNDALRRNEGLCDHVFDTIIEDFVERNNINEGVVFKNDIDERAEKINMVMDAYVNNSNATKSEVMQDKISYMIYRAAEAPKDIVQKAVNIISDSQLCNDKDTVDDILYRMDIKNGVDDENLQKRLDFARREMDKFDNYKHNKTCYKYSDWEVNALNLPVVEMFLNHKELNQDEQWISKMPQVISSINSAETYWKKGHKKVDAYVNEMTVAILEKTKSNMDNRKIISKS